MTADLPGGGLDGDLDEASLILLELDVYEAPRAKVPVDDPGFARVMGLVDATLTHFDSELTAEAGLALMWAVVELSDYSQLEAAQFVGYDLSGRDLVEVLDELGVEVGALVQDSSDLAATLRYLRARSYVSDARDAAAGPGTPERW